jgi:hypothetical protein
MSESNDTTQPSLSRAEQKAVDAACEKMDESQKVAVIRLFRRLLEVREMDAGAHEKLRKALPDEEDTKAALDALQSSASHIKDLAWDDRTWPARVGIGAATVVAASVAGQSAAIALLGTAIAIPLWVVFGAGEDFAKALVAALEDSQEREANAVEILESAEDIPEAEAEVEEEVEVEVEAQPEAEAEDAPEDAEPEEVDIGGPQPDDRDLTKLFYEIRDRGEEAISELRERGETFWQRINREAKED